MYLISVIIPIYNAEKYLNRCIDSIINQSIGFENIELILVDDNSSDNSKNIINEYCKKYSNIKSFFSSTNHGFPGYGRNIGLKNSTAKYIMFIDNDDTYEPDFCETIYNIIENENCDIVSSNYNFIENDVIIKENTFDNIISEKNLKNDNLKLIKLNTFYNIRDIAIWTKIFKSSIIKDNNIKFIEKGLNEDTQFLYNYLFYANNLIYTNYYGYNHYRDGKNLSYYSSKNTLGFINSYYDILDLCEKKYGSVDTVYLFKDGIEGTIYLIMISSHKRCLLEKLYEFENKIRFNSNLNHTWSNICNKLLLKQKYSLLIIILNVLRLFKYILDFLRKKISK